MTTTTKRMITLLVFTLFAIIKLSAQPNPPPTGSGAAIDGGILLLAVSAGVYGYKKMRKQNPKNETLADKK